MSTQLRPAGPVVAGLHPALLGRRLHDLLVTGLAGLIALLVALAVTIEVPNPNPVLIFGLIVGALAVVALVASTRYELTLTLVVLYIGLLDGPIKLLSASQYASAIRDVLIFAIVLSMVARLGLRGQRVTMPPLSGWVVIFVGAVLVQALNPGTAGILKILGGFRQQLEWVPFFFFGYIILRSKQNFRKLFLILGVIALANGVVGAYQSRLSPSSLGSWGPGYNSRINGANGLSGRTYSSEGVARPRPPALGSDSGFGGSTGVLALPGLLALLSIGRVRRRRWVTVLLLAGALLGVATAASRSSIVIAVVALLAYAILSVLAGLRVGRPLLAMLAVAVVAVGVGAVLISADGSGIFARQETLSSTSPESGEAATKFSHFTQLPSDIAGAPLGVGLGTGGSAGGFGGKQKVQIEGSGATKEGALNLVVLETGALGLFLWVGLTISVILLALRRLRLVQDVELRTYLVAIFAAFLAFTADGFAGPTLAVSPAGTFLWFAAGIAAYWLAGPGFTGQRPTIPRPV
ncbi:MAG: hypothetical protein ACLQBY_11575 [Solirubrobacteraceae bacterium]